MTEAFILIAITVALLAVAKGAFSRMAGHRSRRRSAWVWLATGLVSAAATSLGAYQLMNARGVQWIGRIVPRVETGRRVVALTFDDGPTPPFTDDLLRALRSRDAKATFFVTGRNLERFPELARAIVADGHELANHSYSHARMVFVSRDFIQSELERTDVLIRQAGHVGPIHFRAPYQKKLFLLPLHLWREDRTSFSADVEPDARVRPDGGALDIVESTLADIRSGSIIGMHAENPQRSATLEAVPQLVDELTRRGYRLVTVSELIAEAPPRRPR